MQTVSSSILMTNTRSGPAPRTNGKFGNKSLKPELANEASSLKDNKKPKEQAQKRPDLMDKLGKDGKLTPRNGNNTWMVAFAYYVPVAAT